MKLKAFAFLILTFIFPVTMCFAGSGTRLSDIPIQNHGRIKPFSAFAQDTLQFISAKKKWQGQNATRFMMNCLNKPEQFLEIAFIRIDHPQLRIMMGIGEGQTYSSYDQLKSKMTVLSDFVQRVSEKREHDTRPSAMEQQAEILYQRVMAVLHLSTGESITVVPSTVQGGAWVSPFGSAGSSSALFLKITEDCANSSVTLDQSIQAWMKTVEPILGNAGSARIRMEAVYYAVEPFFFAWLFYLCAFIVLMFNTPLFQRVGKLAVMAGFIYHTGGLVLRSLILMRPPVANMFETMIFMDWVLMVCVGVVVLFQKKRAILSCGVLSSALVMLYANLLPVDQTLDVLAPVLRSSFWLTVHVITIISSYSFFTFAMAVAHRQLFLTVRGKLPPFEQRSSARIIYKLLQTGLLLLGAGTILGGVWANEAWGRFWGWDPKETWAFITFLGYMVILHLRYRQKLSDLALAVGSILGFLLVIMTWYGVNFVLGRGLHSYGAGSGGAQWILIYLVCEAIFLIYIFMNARGKRIST